MSGYALVLIGGGNMGAALLTGLMGRPSAAHGTGPGTGLAVVEIEPERRAWLRGAFGSVSVLDEIPTADAAIVATKPDGAADAARRAAAAGARRVLSIAAGVTTSTLDRCRRTRRGRGQGDAEPRCARRARRRRGHRWPRRLLRTTSSGPNRSSGRWAGSIDSTSPTSTPSLRSPDRARATSSPSPSTSSQPASRPICPPPLATDIVRSLFAGVAELLGDDGDPAELRRRVTSPGGHDGGRVGRADTARPASSPRGCRRRRRRSQP
ncbi:MAG: hypothetical protein WKF58_03065 [Ilumatobacteraceae bacterium]